MIKSFPIRGRSHQLEELSERFFRDMLPENWTAERPPSDYGIDLRVDLFEGNHATGLELLVQLKASTVPSGRDMEVVRLNTATYNLLWGKLQVAMLVKFIKNDNEAYWILFRDIPAPSQDHKTFTVHIPRTNRLSSIQWANIQQYVRGITDKKLAALRRHQIRVK